MEKNCWLGRIISCTFRCQEAEGKLKKGWDFDAGICFAPLK
jgi:hypothetical protein